jgi:hypothetical protein
MKSSLKILLLILISLTISCQEESEQTCIPGKNCPYNQGECSDNQCSCKDGFYTLIDPTISIVNQTFCNYEQISRKLMLLFEVLLPGIGQIYSSRLTYGIIKFISFLGYIIISIFEFKYFFIPKCFIIAKNAFFGGGDKGDNNNANNNDGNNEINNEGQYQAINNNGENPNNGENCLINDCINLEPLKTDKFNFKGDKKCETLRRFIYKILIYIFWTVYSIDIYLICFKIYPDGKGIPYSD